MSYEAATDLAVPKRTEPAAKSVFDRMLGRVADLLNAAGSLVIGAVMLLMCADVLLRDLANRPIDGVAELVATSIIVIVFLQLPGTLRHGRMTRADLFLDGFVTRRPRAGRWLRAFFSLAGVFACGVIAYATWPLLVRAWVDVEFLGVQGVFTFPTWPMRAVVVLGSALAAVQYALLAWHDVRESRRAGAG